MKKIEKLTPEQETRLKAVLKEWLEIGRSTDACDRKEAEKSIVALYKRLGKEAPTFFWMPSPLQCMLGIAATKILLKKEGANLGANLRANLGDNLGANLGANLRANLGDNLWANLGANLGANLWANLGANLGDNLRANLGDNLWANLRDNLRDNLRANLEWSYFAGNLWGAWEVFYDFCNEIGVPYSEQNRHDLDLWINQARHCHLWWPMEKVVFISERPESLNVDTNGRLHCENDAALYYHDGYALYYWHGVKIPKWIVENPEQITVAKIEAENNAEIRRIMINKFGMAKYLEQSGAIEVHKDRDTKGERILYSKNDKMGKIQIIKLENSTPERDGSKKFYTFRIPPDVKTCQEAVAYLYSREPKQYKPSMES